MQKQLFSYVGLAAFAVLMQVGAAAAAVNEAISFHGFLTQPDGTKFEENSVVKLDFKLYSSASQGAELLWARRIPVTIDSLSGFYVDIMDMVGQSYQAAGGVTPTCSTLSAALARHAQISTGPVWLAYEVVDATIATPMSRVPLYRQPQAQRASGAQQANLAKVSTVNAGTFATADGATVSAKSVVVDTERMQLGGLSFEVPESEVELNVTGSVKLRNVMGLSSCAAQNLQGTLAADLPEVADSDCGRVVRHSVGGVETLTAIYYSKGDSTIIPAGTTNVYVWSFGPLTK